MFLTLSVPTVLLLGKFVFGCNNYFFLHNFYLWDWWFIANYSIAWSWAKPRNTFSTRNQQRVCVKARVDHTLKPFCITRGPDKSDSLSPSDLHLSGGCVFPKTSAIQGLKKIKKSKKLSKFVKYHGACRNFGNEILAVFNVVWKICEQLRNTRIQIYSCRSNRFYLVILKKLMEFISIFVKLESKQMKNSVA